MKTLWKLSTHANIKATRTHTHTHTQVKNTIRACSPLRTVAEFVLGPQAARWLSLCPWCTGVQDWAGTRSQGAYRAPWLLPHNSIPVHLEGLVQTLVFLVREPAGERPRSPHSINQLCLIPICSLSACKHPPSPLRMCVSARTRTRAHTHAHTHPAS